MKQIFNKIGAVIIVLFISASIVLQPVIAACNPPAGKDCDNAYVSGSNTPNPDYNLTECVNYRLGFCKDNLKNVTNILPERKPDQYLFVVFSILLVIVFVIVVFRIVQSGISIANAKEDSDKRKEGFQKVLNAVIGLIIGFSAYGIAIVVLNISGGKPADTLIDCTIVKANPSDYTQEVQTYCGI